MVKANNLWTLPDGVNEITQDLALPLEELRRKILDEFKVWGYDLVFPPIIEFLDSLLTGSSNELDLQTFKLTDQLSGKLMGVRADMTPQVARIDAHVRKRQAPDRLCYLGPVLRAKPKGFGASRTPIQLGAELFGHQGLASDTEIVKLMLRVVELAKVEKCYLDIGHVGIFHALMAESGLADDARLLIRDMLQRKAVGELDKYLACEDIDKNLSAMLLALPMLCGGTEVLIEADKLLDTVNPNINRALAEMAALVEAVNPDDDIEVVFDLSELRGYSYHTGLVFAVYVEGKGSAIAKGGRYDEIGKVFGRARPATGFSADLVQLLRLSGETNVKQAIFAPALDDTNLAKIIESLRTAGEIVICELPGQSGDVKTLGCNRQLKLISGSWQVTDI